MLYQEPGVSAGIFWEEDKQISPLLPPAPSAAPSRLAEEKYVVDTWMEWEGAERSV